MCLRSPTTIKIDSSGIWWLTGCLNLEGGKNNTRKSTRTHTLSNYTPGRAPMHLPYGGQLESRWKKVAPEYIHFVRLLLKHTRARKAETATCTLPLITLLTFLLDLKATGPLHRWATSKETGRTGPAVAADSVQMISDVFRGVLRGSEACSAPLSRR